MQTIRSAAGDREITVREPRWLIVDAREQRSQEPITVRVSAAEVSALGVPLGSVRLELRGRGRWLALPATEAASGDLVGRFTGEGEVWVRTVGVGGGAEDRGS